MRESDGVADGPESRDARDIVGVGFGPANLALAIAVEEHNEGVPAGREITAQFFEKRDSFGWHPGMLLDGSTMQIAFPKDLVTLRNPQSAYSFFAYLKSRGRLVDFVNHQTFFPSRHEFNDYLTWASGKVDADVRWATAVERVVPVETADGDSLFEVTADDGTRVLARNVVVGAGLRERIPEWAEPSPRCFHNHQFLFRIAEIPEVRNRRFAVLGAGQSAAEIVQYLHRNFPDAEVHNVFGRFGYSPADDSPYANRIFDPDAVDDFYGAPESERKRLLEVHRGTNYSVVDLELINELYALEYQERVRGARRLFMHRSSEITAVDDGPTGISVSVRSTVDGLVDQLECDARVLATGFEPAPLGSLFGDLPEGAEGAIGRDYRLELGISAGIYLQGGTERTHGLTSSLLSNVAVRSGEILTSIVAHTPAREPLAAAGETPEGLGTTIDTVDPIPTYVTSEAR
ncbi:SidA/IucD/PvdA family monooxygenase [Rhodococcus sp. HNM0569]|uniref:lysine N(6)-hydroxylase/L-ornithine N(5)-oxygenase family protein n=1 Tax=Rhodococcus sp. HNM0569 TaxID=2716340 RepID=UPI00146CDFC7|nr:SidA/IucD/PvdA family monooxygenase [Rhodococcus sp. HNM0569]NLU82277.1 lysine N(6)-hydroxylase/L-ornithine N(5)-oxygenase family protein [Rhodococcus sp. HNM0569]